MKKFINLWMPIFLSNTILMLGGLFDTIFLSHYSSVHVAAMAVCLGVYSLVFVSGLGILQGMMQELAEAKGRKAYADIHLIVKQSILIVICLSLFAGWLLTHADLLLDFLKADKALRELIQPCLVLLALTLPGHFLLRVLYIYTQTCGQAKRVFYANILYLFVKVGLAYVFIFGVPQFSIPACGVKGAFIAHFLSQWILLIIYYTFFLEKSLLISWKGRFFNRKILINILKIGLPTAVVSFIDVFAVSAIVLLALPLGDIVVNAHQITLALSGVMFMLPLSLGSTFSILVSTKIGEKNLVDAWILTARALQVASVVGLSISLLLVLFHQQIIVLFSDDDAVLKVVLTLIFLLGWMHIFDAVLVITVNMLRCWKVIVFPMLIYSAMILLFGLGGGWYLAFHSVSFWELNVHALGINGFWLMLCIAYTLASFICLICLKLRYQKYLRHI